MDDILRDLHSSFYIIRKTNSIIALIFIENIFTFLKTLPLRRPPLKFLPGLFRTETCFSFADTPFKKSKWHPVEQILLILAFRSLLLSPWVSVVFG